MIRSGSKTTKDVGVRGLMKQRQEEVLTIFHDFLQQQQKKTKTRYIFNTVIMYHSMLKCIKHLVS